jgi:alpha-beta hydrolase superfamily lysophospholipase
MVQSDKVEFPGAQGAKLAGRLDWPLGPPRAFALFAHCFTCSKDVLASTRISQGLAARGIAVLRFDFTGLGHSGGEFASTNFSSSVQDLVAGVEFLRKTHEAPRILIGHSLGGAAVLAAAGLVSEAVAVATIGAPFDPNHVVHLFDDAIPQINAKGEAQVVLAGRTFTVRKQFLDDIKGQSLQAAVHSLHRALLILHSPVDEYVSIDNARRIYEAALHPKSFISLDGADHLLARPEDAAYVTDLLSSWAARYLKETPQQAPNAAAGTVVVTGAPRSHGESFLAQIVSAAGHLLRGDEPVSNGGSDTGPNPYDFLLTSLGT